MKTIDIEEYTSKKSKTILTQVSMDNFYIHYNMIIKNVRSLLDQYIRQF